MLQTKILKHSYLAGFLDGDGSIHVRLKPNRTYRFGFQISPNIVFYQSKKEKQYLENLQKEYGFGYNRERKDGIVEWVIGDVESISKILQILLPHLVLKKKQARLMIQILRAKTCVKDAEAFLKLAELIDKFEELNYSRKRKINSATVKRFLVKEGLLSP